MSFILFILNRVGSKLHWNHLLDANTYAGFLSNHNFIPFDFALQNVCELNNKNLSEFFLSKI